VRRAIIALILLAAFALGLLVGLEDARGSSFYGPHGETSVKQARAAVVRAERAAARAAKRLREARAVLRETRAANALYGARVGRWLRLARRTGWAWVDMPTLMRIIAAESIGDREALNCYSRCAGLLQLHPCWYAGRWHFDPYNARLNLRYGLRVRRLCGWRAWVTY